MNSQLEQLSTLDLQSTELLESLSQLKTGITPFEFQCSRALDIVNAFKTGKKAFLITDKAGYGKTYIACMAILLLHKQGYFSDYPYLWPVVYVTKANVVEQTKRVIKAFGLSKIVKLVTNYDQFRSSFGEQFIKGQWETERMEEVYRYHWSPLICSAIRLIVLDECQALKNQGADQTRIFQELVDFLATQKAKEHGADKIQFLLTSASPFTRLCEAKLFVTASQIPVRFGWVTEPCTSKHWPSFIQEIAGHTHPEEHSPVACKRLREYMQGYVVSTTYREVQASFAKLGRKLYHAENTTLLIPFRTEEQRAYYAAAWQRYLEQLAKIDRYEPGGIAKIWVAILKFRMASEECRATDIAEAMWRTVQEGKSAVGAFNFKKPIGLAVRYLIEVKGVAREDISIIWGGIDELEEDCEYLGLGPQSKRQRQAEIDKFQSDKSHYCLFTYKSGGVGLSLHHAEPWMRVRETYLGPTYSAIELVQGTGRVPRITSWSNTRQTMLGYQGTIEVQVLAKVGLKMKCLHEVVNARESWNDVLIPEDDEQMASLKRSFIDVESSTQKVDEEEADGLYIEDSSVHEIDMGDGGSVDIKQMKRVKTWEEE